MKGGGLPKHRSSPNDELSTKPGELHYHYFRKWRLDGTWERLHTALREALRAQVGREPQPSAGVIDSQSAKSSEQGGPRGFDGGKKVSGRKRHVVVDTQGLVLRVVVHPANLHDRVGAKLVLQGLDHTSPRLRHLWADQGYAGALRDWTRQQTGIELEVVYPWWRQIKRYMPELLEPLGVGEGFHVLPRRWVVERTFAWLGRYRRLSRDYERPAATTEALVLVAMSRLMLRRLARL
jgi:putative transposase